MDTFNMFLKICFFLTQIFLQNDIVNLLKCHTFVHLTHGVCRHIGLQNFACFIQYFYQKKREKNKEY